jgi:hypothetical protein
MPLAAIICLILAIADLLRPRIGTQFLDGDSPKIRHLAELDL